MTLDRLIEILLSVQATNGGQEVHIMLERKEPRVQINDVVRDVATSSYGVIIIGTEFED